MIVGIGTAVLEVARMERELRTGGSSFRDEVFTPAEVDACEGKRYPHRHFAARFAAKEALLKALSVDATGGLRFREAEIRNDASGQPRLALTGELARLAERRGVSRIFVSLSHTDELAAATVVLESDGARAPREVNG